MHIKHETRRVFVKSLSETIKPVTCHVTFRLNLTSDRPKKIHLCDIWMALQRLCSVNITYSAAATWPSHYALAGSPFSFQPILSASSHVTINIIEVYNFRSSLISGSSLLAFLRGW